MQPPSIWSTIKAEVSPFSFRNRKHEEMYQVSLILSYVQPKLQGLFSSPSCSRTPLFLCLHNCDFWYNLFFFFFFNVSTCLIDLSSIYWAKLERQDFVVENHLYLIVCSEGTWLPHPSAVGSWKSNFHNVLLPLERSTVDVNFIPFLLRKGILSLTYY